MSAILLNSTPVINQEIGRLKNICTEMKEKKRAPKMVVILVGNNPASAIYVKHKKIFCEQIGAVCQILHLDEKISKEDFLKEVEKNNQDKNTDGLIVQLPLPKQLNELNLGTLIPAHKDLDGFNLENLYDLYTGKLDGIQPCTPKGIIKLLKYYNVPIANKKVTIIGRGMLVGKPLFHLLTSLNATVTLCHSKSNIEHHINDCDIIILAAGSPNLLNSVNFKPVGSPVIIDVGINIMKGKVIGDCDYKTLSSIVAAITPVPKGVGPMTIWGLVDNLITLARKNI